MASRILLVDDEVSILLAFRKLLQSAECKVDTAQTIEEAEGLLRQNSYAVVIADLRLTGVLGEEGLEIIKYIREHRFDTRVVLITGYGSLELMNRAYELGADRYFEKPVTAAVLKATLAELGVVTA